MRKREGDWDCPRCGEMVFKAKDHCFKCGQARLDPARAERRRSACRAVGDKVHYWSKTYGMWIVTTVVALPAEGVLDLHCKRRVPAAQVQDVDVARLRAAFDGVAAGSPAPAHPGAARRHAADAERLVARAPVAVASAEELAAAASSPAPEESPEAPEDLPSDHGKAPGRGRADGPGSPGPRAEVARGTLSP